MSCAQEPQKPDKRYEMKELKAARMLNKHMPAHGHKRDRPQCTARLYTRSELRYRSAKAQRTRISFSTTVHMVPYTYGFLVSCPVPTQHSYSCSPPSMRSSMTVACWSEKRYVHELFSFCCESVSPKWIIIEGISRMQQRGPEKAFSALLPPRAQACKIIGATAAADPPGVAGCRRSPCAHALS